MNEKRELRFELTFATKEQIEDYEATIEKLKNGDKKNRVNFFSQMFEDLIKERDVVLEVMKSSDFLFEKEEQSAFFFAKKKLEKVLDSSMHNVLALKDIPMHLIFYYLVRQANSVSWYFQETFYLTVDFSEKYLREILVGLYETGNIIGEELENKQLTNYSALETIFAFGFRSGILSTDIRNAVVKAITADPLAADKAILFLDLMEQTLFPNSSSYTWVTSYD